jgi:hypothetical protein
MKTAMQELIDVLDINEANFISRIDDKITIAYHNVIRKTVTSFLEKEKDQIIDACNSAFEDKTTWGERYYNKTYNQNK